MVWKAKPDDQYERYYEGEWVHDRRTGHGKHQYADGYVYIGDFKDNKRHGSGTLFLSTDSRDASKPHITCHWFKDKIDWAAYEKEIISGNSLIAKASDIRSCKRHAEVNFVLCVK